MVREHVAVKDNVQKALFASVLIFRKGKKYIQNKIYQNTNRENQAASH